MVVEGALCLKRIDGFAHGVHRSDICENVSNRLFFRFGERFSVGGVEDDLPDAAARIGETFGKLVDGFLGRNAFDRHCRREGSAGGCRGADGDSENCGPNKNHSPCATRSEETEAVEKL